MSEVKKKIREILDAAPRAPEPPAPPAPAEPGLLLHAGRDMKNVTVISRSNIHISPGVEHIDQAQTARLKTMVEDVSRLERVHAGNKVSTALVWKKLKDALAVSSYKYILKEQFPEAVSFLGAWQEQAMRDASRAGSSLGERSGIFKACHAIAKRYGLYSEMRTLLERKWDTDSMRDLEDHELRELMRFMRALESQYKDSDG